MSVSEWLLVVCCADCCLYCYDLKSGQLVKKLSNAMSGAKAAVAVICLPLSDPASKAYRLLKKPLIEQLGHFRIVVGGLCGVVRQLNAKNSQRVFPNVNKKTSSLLLDIWILIFIFYFFKFFFFSCGPHFAGHVECFRSRLHGEQQAERQHPHRLPQRRHPRLPPEERAHGAGRF